MDPDTTLANSLGPSITIAMASVAALATQISKALASAWPLDTIVVSGS